MLNNTDRNATQMMKVGYGWSSARSQRTPRHHIILRQERSGIENENRVRVYRICQGVSTAKTSATVWAHARNLDNILPYNEEVALSCRLSWKDLQLSLPSVKSRETPALPAIGAGQTR